MMLFEASCLDRAVRGIESAVRGILPRTPIHAVRGILPRAPILSLSAITGDQHKLKYTELADKLKTQIKTLEEVKKQMPSKAQLAS